MKQQVLGSLVGVALGDALGMPAEFMTQADIKKTYGTLRELRAPDPKHYHHHHLGRAQITDDTEQTLALLDAYFRHGELTAKVAAEALITWAKDKDVFNSTYLGPSSKKALERLMEGDDPKETGLFGTTIGGAMRMLPVALTCLGDVERAIEIGAQVSMPTHGTSHAISGATAMAAGLVEAFKPGVSKEDVITAACHGAQRGLSFGFPYPGPSIAKRIRWAVDIAVSEPTVKGAVAELYDYVGVDMVPHEIVPVVMALFARSDEPMELIIGAANIGGDTDTIASMLGSLLGAYYGVDAFPLEMWKEIEAVNNLDLEAYAEKLMLQSDTRRVSG